MSQANLRQAVALRSVQILVNAIRNEPKNARKKAVAALDRVQAAMKGGE